MRFILIAFILMILPVVTAQSVLTWELFHPIKKVWINAGSHQSVQEILMNQGELPNPFVGENENKFSWIENQTWQFKANYYCSQEEMQKTFVELFLPYLDTYAAIYINDSLIANTDNAFRPYHLQIKPYLKVGENRFKVIFTPPILYHKEKYTQREVTYPAPNDSGEIPIAPLTRKPQYQFGWDWALRMNTVGFMKPVEIRSYTVNKLENVKIETKEIGENSAKLKLSLAFVIPNTTSIRLESEIFGSFPALLVTNGKTQVDVTLKQPKLWWPRGQGEAYLYHDFWKIYNLDNILIDSLPVTFGVRTSCLVQQKDSVGTSYFFQINGRPVFCKGANYIPQDVFPARVSDASIRTMVQQMKEANFNIVRVWGGGYYPDEVFYQECDRQGIMVWQDVMFACAMYPGDSSFLKNVESELNYQIPRIASHPSVIQFNGNNEVEVAWKYWGFKPKYLITNKQAAIMEEGYDALFKKLIPKIIDENTFIPYIHTSPLGHWTEKEDFPHGTQHYWGVWHGKDPIEDFGKKSGRFNAEYGFQSFPEYSTLLSFSNKSDWDLNSSVMKNHQKSYVGNGMIKKHSDILFGKTDDFQEFVYFSQLTQAKAVSIAISAHRLNAPTCMGTIFWQLNDCWPAPTWSSIDYYGNWKALQFLVKQDFEDVTVLEKTDRLGEEEFYFTSDAPDKFETEIKYEIYSVAGNLLHKKSKKVSVYNGYKLKVNPGENYDATLPSIYAVKFTWNNADNVSQERLFVHVKNNTGYQKAKSQDFQWEIKVIDTIQKTAVIKINTSKFLQDLWFSSLKLGVKYDRNFISILPGEHLIQISYKGYVPVKEDFILNWR